MTKENVYLLQMNKCFLKKSVKAFFSFGNIKQYENYKYILNAIRDNNLALQKYVLKNLTKDGAIFGD